MTRTSMELPWNFHDLNNSAQGPPRDLGWHFGHRGRTRSSALPRPPAPHLACCNAPPGATELTKPPACVVGTDLKDRSMMGPKLRNRSLTAGKHVEHHVMRRLRLLRRRGASGGCPWRCGTPHWMTRGSRWIWRLDFRILLEICRRTWFHDHPLAKNMIGSQPVAPWGSYCTQLDVVESCRTDDPPSAGLCPRFPWPRWCHWHGVLWSLPARVGPCASDKMALPVIRTAQVQHWGHHFVNFNLHHLFLHLALWSAWHNHK